MLLFTYQGRWVVQRRRIVYWEIPNTTWINPLHGKEGSVFRHPKQQCFSQSRFNSFHLPCLWHFYVLLSSHFVDSLLFCNLFIHFCIVVNPTSYQSVYIIEKLRGTSRRYIGENLILIVYKLLPNIYVGWGFLTFEYTLVLILVGDL